MRVCPHVACTNIGECNCTLNEMSAGLLEHAQRVHAPRQVVELVEAARKARSKTEAVLVQLAWARAKGREEDGSMHVEVTPTMKARLDPMVVAQLALGMVDCPVNKDHRVPKSSLQHHMVCQRYQGGHWYCAC